MADPIYLDYNATTPVAPEVLEAMLPALRDAWGNPSSGHVFGRRAARALQTARHQVASLLRCDDDEIVFTSGGTESNNMALIGVATALSGHGRHLVTTVIEHPAIEEVCRELERRGWAVTRVGVDTSGRLDPSAIREALRPDTVLISIMHANNETGVIQPLAEVAGIAREHGCLLHTDAAQSAGKIPTEVDELGVDLLSLAGHKLYAPKGVGALYIRRGTPCGRLMQGAGHEGGRRPGTEATPTIVGLGAACDLARVELRARMEMCRTLRDRLEEALRLKIPGLVIHGNGAPRLPNTLSVAIPGAPANDVLTRLPDIAAAAGSACHSGRVEPSAVLRAMQVPDTLALSTLRLTVGRDTTAGEIDIAAVRIHEAAEASGLTLRHPAR